MDDCTFFSDNEIDEGALRGNLGLVVWIRQLRLQEQAKLLVVRNLLTYTHDVSKDIHI